MDLIAFFVNKSDFCVSYCAILVANLGIGNVFYLFYYNIDIVAIMSFTLIYYLETLYGFAVVVFQFPLIEN